jgi:hypothetical protein
MLMENDPLPDFEMHFYDGTKVYTSVGRKQLEIRLATETGADGQPRVIVIDLEQYPLTVAQDLLPIFKHAQECLRQCMDFEKSTRSKNPDDFPLVLKSNRCDQPTGHGDTEPNRLPPTRSSVGTVNVSIHSDKLRSPRGSFVIGETRSFESRLTSAQHETRSRREPEHYDEMLAPHNKPRQEKLDRSGAASSVSSGTLVPPRGERAGGGGDYSRDRSRERSHDRPYEPPPADRPPVRYDDNTTGAEAVQVKFVENVGWCLRVGSGNFRLLFNDGIQINVYLDQQALLWSDERAQASVRWVALARSRPLCWN